jgi:tRNA A-37 threonylcarbamoyl transferase component Bud32
MDGREAALDDSAMPDSLFLKALRSAVAAHRTGPSDGAPADEEAAGWRIGRFVVLDELGDGGYGTVLRVRDPRLGCERALKVPNAEVLESPAALARFEEEARKSAAIDHPNVVLVTEADTVGGIPYLVMEYCPGGSLAKWLEERPTARPLPAPWAARLVAELADGVQQAHARGVLHRDLKPGNVLLVPVGAVGPDEDPPQFRAKVGDFGLAKVRSEAEAGRGDTPSGAVVGTYAYASPEQARGDGQAVGPASDVYGLGAILYELLARRRPHEATDLPELLAQIAGHDPLPALREARPDLPRDLETICRTCLAKAPGDRYATAMELAADLRRHLGGEPVRGSPWWKRARAWARRRRKLAAPAAVATLAVALLAAFFLSEDRRTAETWLTQIRAAGVVDLPGLAPRGDALGARVAGPLDAMFDGDDSREKFNAAVVRAPSRPDCADYATTRLLDAPAGDLGGIARALDGRVEGLADKLHKIAGAPSTARDAPARDRDDRRRANAAAALVLLGRPGAGLDLLRGAPDPQARSYLIHTLGPTGVAPAALLDRLEHEGDASIRLALIQALGEMPPQAWTSPELKEKAAAKVRSLYRDDRHAGVHGSAKWLLRRWGRDGEIDAIDAELRGKVRDGFGWRIGRSGLTFVRIDDREAGRAIEISDTEIPRDLFLRFRPKHDYLTWASPEPDCPMTGVNYLAAAEFCNWLGDEEGIPAGERCYRTGGPLPIGPFEGSTNRAGFRLPTDREFELASRAGTTTVRHFGDSAALLPSYAWYVGNIGPAARTHRAGRLKPNDFGLFDTLGNAHDLCQLDGAPAEDRNQAAWCGGSYLNPDRAITSDRCIAPAAIDQTTSINGVGFRVVRTVPR